MVLASIIFSLFIIVIYQRSLKKTSLEIKTISQLHQMRQEAFLKYAHAKEMRLYGEMGHRAEKIYMIDKALSKKTLAHQKEESIHYKDTVKFNTLHATKIK